VTGLVFSPGTPNKCILRKPIYIYTHIYLYIYIMYTVFSSIIYKHNYCILFTMNIYYIWYFCGEKIVRTTYIFIDQIYITMNLRGRRGRDPMVVEFTTTYAISAYHHWCWGRISIRSRCTTLCDKVCQWLVSRSVYNWNTAQLALSNFPGEN
jgi:hypothetical protein